MTKLTEAYPWPGGLVTTDEGGITKGGIPGWHGDERSKPKGGYKTYTSIVSHNPSTLPEPYKTTYDMCVKTGKKNKARRELFFEGQGITTSSSSNPRNRLDISSMEGEAIILDRFALIFNGDADEGDVVVDNDGGDAKKDDSDGPGKNDYDIRQKLVNDIFLDEEQRLTGTQGASGALILQRAYLRMISIYPVIASKAYAENVEAQALAAGNFNIGVSRGFLTVNPQNANQSSARRGSFYVPLPSVEKGESEILDNIDDVLYRSFIATANGLNAKELFEVQKYSEERARTAGDGISMLPLVRPNTSLYSKKFNELLFPTRDTTHFKASSWFERNVAAFMTDTLNKAGKKTFLQSVNQDQLRS